jgi:transcriptional regulator with XRE-family HTH domain
MSEVNIGNGGRGLAAELRRIRAEAGLSQDQMGLRLGMAYTSGGSTRRAAVSAWESGRRTPPPQYLKAYIDLGGDPAILTVPQAEPRPRELPDDPPRAADAERRPADDTSSAEPVDATPGPPHRLGRRRPWVAAGLSAVVVAAAATIFAVTYHSTPSASAQSAPTSTVPASTWTETTGTPAHTWANPVQLTGAGAPLGPRQSIQVLCVTRGYVVQDGDPWWYRIESSPWDGKYYATSDAFYNDGAISGNVDDGVVVDPQVPVC